MTTAARYRVILMLPAVIMIVRMHIIFIIIFTMIVKRVHLRDGIIYK